MLRSVFCFQIHCLWWDLYITVWFGCSEREYNKGDEIAWYADGDKIVRNEYNPATAYAFGILCSCSDWVCWSLFLV